MLDVDNSLEVVTPSRITLSRWYRHQHAIIMFLTSALGDHISQQTRRHGYCRQETQRRRRLGRRSGVGLGRAASAPADSRTVPLILPTRLGDGNRRRDLHQTRVSFG